jgi:hypothetical protein
MSPLFLRNFKKEHRCTTCVREPKAGYTLCALHLIEARQFWRGFQEARRALGKCCWCNKKSWGGFLRCAHHREENRLRSKNWCLSHPEHEQKKRAQEKAYIASGHCPKCKEHRQLPEGRTRCASCNARQRAYCNGTYVRPPAGPVKPYAEKWGDEKNE